MTRRKRGTLIALAVLALLVVAEVGLHLMKGSEACVEVQNLGTESIEGLVFTAGESRATAPRVEPGGTTRVFLGGDGPRTLQVSFRQAGNAMTSYQLPGFDPGTMSAEGAKLVLQIRPNEVIRFQDDADPSSPLGRYLRDTWARALRSLDVAP